MQTTAGPDAYQAWAKEFLAYGCSEEEGHRRYAWFLAELVRVGADQLQHLIALRVMAVEIAWEYHRRERRLFTSKHGAISWGRGGQEREDWHRYSKAYHRSHGPARWKNAGVRLDSETQPTCIILENHRGKEVARINLME